MLTRQHISKPKTTKEKENANIQQLKEKWATFTYHGKQT
jgi:hypothetical protein